MVHCIVAILAWEAFVCMFLDWLNIYWNSCWKVREFNSSVSVATHPNVMRKQQHFSYIFHNCHYSTVLKILFFCTIVGLVCIWNFCFLLLFSKWLWTYLMPFFYFSNYLSIYVVNFVYFMNFKNLIFMLNFDRITVPSWVILIYCTYYMINI